MAAKIPLEIQDLIITQVAASSDADADHHQTLLACQLVCHTFHLRSACHLFSSITINRVQSPDIKTRLALLKEIMIGGPLPGVTAHIKKFTINAKVSCTKQLMKHMKTLTEEFFAQFDLCIILRRLLTDGRSRLQHLSVLLNHGFEWSALHCAFEHSFSCLSKSPNIQIITLEGLSGIPASFILGTKWKKLCLLQSFLKEENPEVEESDSEDDGIQSTPTPRLPPPPLKYLHIHDQFPASILLSRGKSLGPKINIVDLSVSIRTPEGFSTVENIGRLGADVIGNVERLVLRFNAKSPALPRYDPFTWWLHFPTLRMLDFHYRHTRISSSTDKLAKNARAILLPPTTLTGVTTSITTLTLEFDFKTKAPFDPSTPEYQSLIDPSRWLKWAWLDETLVHPFYASLETVRIGVRVSVCPPPQDQNQIEETKSEPDSDVDEDVDIIKEFITSIRNIFKESVVPVLWEKGRVEIECWLVSGGK